MLSVEQADPFSGVLGAHRGLRVGAPTGEDVARAGELDLVGALQALTRERPASRLGAALENRAAALITDSVAESMTEDVFDYSEHVGLRHPGDDILVARGRRSRHLWPDGPRFSRNFHLEKHGGIDVDYGQTLCGQTVVGTLDDVPKDSWRRLGRHKLDDICGHCQAHPDAPALLAFARQRLPITPQREARARAVAIHAVLAALGRTRLRVNVSALEAAAHGGWTTGLLDAIAEEASARGAKALRDIGSDDQFCYEYCRAASDVWGQNHDRRHDYGKLFAGVLLSLADWKALLQSCTDGDLLSLNSERRTNLAWQAVRQAGVVMRERARAIA